MGEQLPFIGSEALASGALNRYELRRFHRAIMPNVYLDKRIDPTLYQRTVAAWCGRVGKPWSPDGVVTRADLLAPDEYLSLDGLPVTTPERTAFDLGRRGRLDTAVARLDALAAATGFTACGVVNLARAHRHARGLRQLEEALELMDYGAESPKETWLRLLAVRAGYPRPRTQIPVPGPDGRPLYYLDMRWDDMMLALEYEGGQHWGDARRVAYDIRRAEYLVYAGWTVVRVTNAHHPVDVRLRLRQAWHRSSR